MKLINVTVSAFVNKMIKHPEPVIFRNTKLDIPLDTLSMT